MNKINIATVCIAILIIIGLVWIISFEGKGEAKSKIDTEEYKVINYEEIRGVWISYLDLAPMLKGKSEKAFKENISSALDNIEGLGLNTLIVQVRPFSDAIYKSKYYPWSVYCTGTEGKDPGFDPLEIIIAQAHGRGIRVEAWVNPYRVRTDSEKFKVSSASPASKWINEDSDNVINYDGGIYYNPGKAEVRELIVNGIKEIVENYKVDGIHFDDYFYPTGDKAIDEKAYGEYTSSGGKLDLPSWRMENVNILIKEVYTEIKKTNSKIIFGVSPQGSMNNNYNSQYIDVKKWVQNPGYIDYICPQVYYGFSNEGSNFQSVIEEFNNLITESKVKLYIGLATYKLGKEDSWAGSGSDEWKNSTDILKRQVEASRKLEKYDGIMFFRYDSLFNPEAQVKSQVDKEKDNLKSILN